MESSPPRITRRQAFKRSALLAAPLIVPSSVLGLGGAIAPSERITVAMIGMGMISGGHLGSNLSNPAVEVVAVCDVKRRAREAAQAKANQVRAGCDAYNEYERIMERDDIDACFVTTPDHWHVPIALAAIRTGKDVYVEKPMTLTIHEGRILADAVRRYGRVLQVGSQQRSETAFRRAAEMVRNGWIGTIREVRTGLGRFAPPVVLAEEPIPEDIDYDRWLGSTPWMPYNPERVLGNYGGGWRRFWEYGSRKNGDWGAHHYDIIQWALGKDTTGPTEFFPAGQDGVAYQGYRYADGPVIYRDHPDRNRQMIHFIGDEGTVSVSRGGRLATSPESLMHDTPRTTDRRLYVSRDHRANFFHCMRSRKRPIADVEIGHRTATICHLSAISERLDRPIRWDPATESIQGDDQAARWLSRPRRAPYYL